MPPRGCRCARRDRLLTLRDSHSSRVVSPVARPVPRRTAAASRRSDSMNPPSAQYHPDFDRFCELARDADLVPVYRRLVSDSLTPVSAFHKIDAGRCACLFESVVGGEKVGRYSFLATDPFLEIEAYDHRVTVSSPSGVGASGRRFGHAATGSATIRWRSCDAGSNRSARPRCRTAAVLRRGRRLCGLRCGPLLREFAAPAARRPPGARHGVCLLRPDGRLRPRGQDDRRRGDGPARQARRDAQGGLRRRLPPHR